MRRTSNFLPPLIAMGLTASVMLSCATNPATGQGNLVMTSQSRELTIGKEEHEKVMQSMRAYDDEKINAYVRSVGERLAAVSHRPDLEWTFTVIDSPEINAFALPGGYVYVNRGLLVFLNSEAELAAVLAHEIGHITARHAIQQQSRRTLGNVASGVGGFVAAVATGSGFIGSQIAEVSSLYAVAGLSGFGREHELEADSLSAEYLYKAGYNPNAIIDALTVLKNQEDFNVKVANKQPKYHGLFSTHPRNDTRLQQAVASAGRLSADQMRETDPAVFRQNMEGLIVGERTHAGPGRNRYFQDLLGYTVVFPDGWTMTETPTTVMAKAPDDSARLNIEVMRLQENKEPRLFIRENLGIAGLERSEELNQYRLRGYTGSVRSNSTTIPERLAVIYFGQRAYIFRGEIMDGERASQLDQLLLASIRTFRAIQANERRNEGEPRIRFVQASDSFSFPALARISPVGQYPEETLRLLNGYYPIGNPQPGDWIKIVE
jgi:predicted Zn-dependent protease